MTLYQKIDGVWTPCQRPYVLQNGVWKAVSEAYVKRSGSWVRAYEYDVTPPNPPEIDLSIYEDYATVKGQKQLQSRWINVGVRLPGTSNDPDARLTRVLTDYNGKAPATQFGGTYTSGPDSSYPNEPWSEWRYNSYGGHNDTSVLITKQWPRNASPGTMIKGDQDYHFGAWSLDDSGNWSIATQAVISVPKAGKDVPNVVTKETTFQPNSSGSWRNDGFHSGDLIQQKSPRSQGLWFYGNQISDSMGAQGTVSVKAAQIRVIRENDTGPANANVYLFWTGYSNVAALPPSSGSLNKNESTKLGTLAKGQGQWFDLPSSFYGDLNKNIKGMGLDWKDPAKADASNADSSQIVSVGDNLHSGEIHVVWEETL